MTTIINARPYIGGQIHEPTNISFENGVITALGKMQDSGDIIDANYNIVAPGYIDIHTHGGFGKDCMEPSVEAIETIARYHLSTGITSFCPTTMTASFKDIEKAILNINNYKSKYAKIIGIHLEGPYLSAAAAGAHPKELLLDPIDANTSLIWKYADSISRITLAPNLKNAAQFTEKAVKHNIQISLGHDNSIDDEINACVEKGASSVTHMYNCTSRPSRRDNPKKHLGLTEMGLIKDELVCEVIADNRHVPNALFNMIYKLKGADKICLVSDSLSVAGQKEGLYYLGSGESQQEILIEDGVAVLPKANTYAGSITPISKMVALLFAQGYSAEECIQMATQVPAKVLGLKDRGDILPGLAADFNILDNNLNVIKTIINGELVTL